MFHEGRNIGKGQTASRYRVRRHSMNFVYPNIPEAHALILFTLVGIVARRASHAEGGAACAINPNPGRHPRLAATSMEANLEHQTKYLVSIEFRQDPDYTFHGVFAPSFFGRIPCRSARSKVESAERFAPLSKRHSKRTSDNTRLPSPGF